jgi:acetyl-CoA acyltransferase 1
MSEVVLSNKQAADSLLPMGITSENVAERFGVSREKQDKLAVASHQKAFRAQKEGWFKDEIVVCEVNGSQKVEKDDGIRGQTTFEVLSKLKPAFKENGTTTAGNASQVTDGAAAVLLMKRRKAQELRLPILGKWISYAVAGVPPDVMGNFKFR